MLLARMDPILDNQQPEEQHGFRAHNRLEEHLITPNVVIDKLLGINKPIWIVNLNFSKAFGRINWDALWLFFRDHCISQHLVWVLLSRWRNCATCEYSCMVNT